MTNIKDFWTQIHLKDICFPSRSHVEALLVTSGVSGAIEMGIVLYCIIVTQMCKNCR